MIDAEEIKKDWEDLRMMLAKMLGKKPADLNEVLYLIGIQELGKGVRKFTKEEKQDLMHIATCKVLSYSGYYELEGLDEEGWPHWKNVSTIPTMKVKEQERFIQGHVIEYFKKEFQ